ncbi:MAG: 6-phosphogluconolactonase [Bdellovibrionota bacterium]|nr:MAG: 6-phosphogluconolactonase [Bdellovibrionota bacterium]
MAANVEVIEPRLFESVIADEIVAVINEVLGEHPYCAISLAGGSTPGGVYRALARPPRLDDVEWKRVKLFLGDERWVPIDDTQSNFRMVRETMLSLLPEPGPKAFPVDTTLASPAESAKAYASLLKRELAADSQGAPHFHLVLLGVGSDGHTASLFPGDPLVADGALVAGACKDPSGQTDRITLGPSVLFRADKVFFIVKGEEKAEVVRRILEGSETVNEVPARLYADAHSEVTFFVDSGAAKHLSR